MNTTQRKDLVLASVVELYALTGEPVGSKSVSARLNDICSTATIRNDMCELIEKGYLIQPHTSAGRIPSAAGYRYYIDRLMPVRSVSVMERERIRQRLPRFRGDTDLYVAEVGKAVAGLTGRTVLITAPIDADATLMRMELLPMSAHTVLVAVLTSSGAMKSKVCRLDEAVTAKELDQFSRVLNERFSDLPLNRITPAMAQTLAISLGAHTLKFAPLLELVFDAVQDAVRWSLHLEGQTNLLLYKEFSPASVIELFTRRDSLLAYLQQAIGTTTYLGPELQDEALQNASLIVSDYALNNHLRGKLAVLGPLKTDYAHVIPVVEYIAGATKEHMKSYM